MIIEGEINEVMETWPLQLSISTSENLHNFILDQNVKVMIQDRVVDVKYLKPNLRIQAEAEILNSNTNILKVIKILEQEDENDS